jgi:hypothetical protein
VSDPSLPFDWEDCTDDELDLIAAESSDATSVRCAEREIVVRQITRALDAAGRDTPATAHAVLAEARFRAGQIAAPGADTWEAAIPGLEWLETAVTAAWPDAERVAVVLDLAEAFAAGSALVAHVVARLRERTGNAQ